MKPVFASHRTVSTVLALMLVAAGIAHCRLIPTGASATNTGEPNTADRNKSTGPSDKPTPRTPGNAHRPREMRASRENPGTRRLRPPFPEANPGELFFLLPSPFAVSAGKNPSGTANRRGMLDLFSAPLMDRSLIIASAGKLEINSRALLAERRARLCAILRNAPKPKHRALLDFWRASARAQLRAWRLSAAHLDAGMDLYIKRARRSGTLLSDPARPLKLVRSLRLERQQLIVRWWERFFQGLNRPGSACTAPPGVSKGKAVGSPRRIGPRERLFEPLALARYDFLRQLPGEFRLRLILTFHSPRNSDK